MRLQVAFFRLSVVCAVGLVAGIACPARAESDYEYAKQLIELNSASFSTEDLIERLAAKLDESTAPKSKMEAKLIKAAWKRRKAAEATVEKQVALLKEASELYKEVVAGDKTFRLYDTAVKDSDAINMEVIQALVTGAPSPAEAKKYRAEAGAMFDKRATLYKDEAEKAYPDFQAALKRFNVEMAKINPNGDNSRVPGPAFIEPLDRTFYAWNVPDRKYVAMKIKQVDVLDESDPDRKKIATEIAAHCKKRVDDEVMMDFPALSAQYSYFQGNLFAAIGNEDEAAKSWNDVLEIDLTQQSEEVKKQVLQIFKLVIHDLVKMKMKSKKYPDVEEYILKVKTGPLRTIFDEDIGKELIIEYAKALTIPAENAAEYEKAVKELRAAIAKERAGSTWSNDFSRAMAEILIDARNKKIVPHLKAEEWYDAAHGMHLMGRYIYTQEYERFNNSADPKDKETAKVKFQEAYKEFANAVDYYRRAIAEARRADHTSLAVRLNIEPKAWFEMGLSYVRMKHDYEAIIAYKAMRDSFLPDNRAKWLPDRKKEPKAYTKEIEEALKVLDLPRERDGMLAKSGSNIIYALDQNEKEHKDAWNILLKPKIMGIEVAKGGSLDPDNYSDQDYIIADGDAKSANNLSDAAKKSENEAKDLGNTEEAKNKIQNAGELWKQALAKNLSAAEKFTKVKVSSPVYDFALVHHAFSLTQAQQIVSEGRIPKMDPKDADTQGKELAQKALDSYAKYDDFVAKNPTTDEKILARRKKAQGMILLARNSLYIGANKWDDAVKTADEYIAFEAENPQPRPSAHVAYLNKFRALLALAAENIAPKSDPYLKNCLATLREYRRANKNDNKLYVFMLNVLSDRYNVAGFQLDKKKKTETGLSKEEQDNLDAMIDLYENKVAELQGERVDIIETGDDLTLDDYSRLVYLFNKTNQIQKATDIAIKMLQRFDKDKKSLRMPDDKNFWKAYLLAMQRQVHYDSIDRQDRCLKEHGVLVDYMYDTDEGYQLPENDPKRPKFDMLNQNMEKALAKLDSIKNKDGEFKDCGTLLVGPKPGAPVGDYDLYKTLETAGIKLGNKSYMALLEEEIQFRRKIVAARDLLSEVALVVATKLRKDGSEAESLKYMAVAKEQIELLKDLKGEAGGPAIEIKLAEIDIALGKIDDAIARLINVKAKFAPESEKYFYVSRLLSELSAEKKKWDDAADFPSFVVVTQGFNSDVVKKRWPDLVGFMKLCVENKAKIPPAAMIALDVKFAEQDIAAGKSDEAVARLVALKGRVDPTSEKYFHINKLLSELYADKKKWDEAAEFPAAVVAAQGFKNELVNRRWPELKAFLKQCVDNGAKIPPAAKKALDAELAKTTEAPKDAPKEAPKEAPKVELPK